jgi:glutathione peroxidase
MKNSIVQNWQDLLKVYVFSPDWTTCEDAHSPERQILLFRPCWIIFSAIMAQTIYEFSAKTIQGKEQSLAEYKGKVVLIVNTASKCGFTPQYAGLEALYEKYKDQGFVILGFPCNQFGAQEPGSETEIEQFCQVNYGVKFPMFGKIDVNGSNAHPLYKFLTSEKPGILGTEAIKWNFTKFLVDKNGNPVKRYAPNIKPEDIADDIEKLLKA